MTFTKKVGKKTGCFNMSKPPTGHKTYHISKNDENSQRFWEEKKEAEKKKNKHTFSAFGIYGSCLNDNTQVKNRFMILINEINKHVTGNISRFSVCTALAWTRTPGWLLAYVENRWDLCVGMVVPLSMSLAITPPAVCQKNKKKKKDKRIARANRGRMSAQERGERNSLNPAAGGQVLRHGRGVKGLVAIINSGRRC